jgi:hypothetical protein
MDQLNLLDINVDDPARAFAAMVEHVRRNDVARFGGAFVVVPPKGAGDVLEVLILDPHQEPAQFWSILKTKAEMALAALDEEQRRQRAFGR